MKKPIDIEALLQWAYRDELPKKRDGEDVWSRLAMLGTRIDDDNSPPGFPINMGAPHPDALVIDHAVRGLEVQRIDYAASKASLMGDLAALVDENAPALRYNVVSPAALVTLYARLARRPVWDLGRPEPKPTTGANGKAVVQYEDGGKALVVGRLKNRHYGPGARCPLQWDPPLPDIVFARAEYACWHAALVSLTATLRAWNLRDHEPRMPSVKAEPWNHPPERKPSILYSLVPSRPFLGRAELGAAMVA